VTVAYYDGGSWPGGGLWRNALDVLEQLPEWARECEASAALHCVRRVLLSNDFMLEYFLSSSQAVVESHAVSLVRCSSGRRERYLQSALDAVDAAYGSATRRGLISTDYGEARQGWLRIIKCAEVLNALLPMLRERADAREWAGRAAQMSGLASSIRRVLNENQT